MSYPAAVSLACLAMAIVVGMIHQAWTYLRGMTVLSGRQFGLRMATGALLLICIGMVFYSVVRPPVTPVTALVFWGGLTLLPLVVIVLAWLDLRELSRIRHQRQAELYRGLAELERELRAKREAGKPREDGSP